MRPALNASFLRTPQGWPYLLVPLIPIAVVLELVHAEATIVFAASAGFELGAILLAILIANYVTQDGESTWFEGVQLLAVYFVFGLAFYFA